MPLSCPSKVRYRYKGKTRLAFCGSKVIEAKSESGKVHTQAEFAKDRARKKTKGRALGR
jgi:hypothetical protein